MTDMPSKSTTTSAACLCEQIPVQQQIEVADLDLAAPTARSTWQLAAIVIALLLCLFVSALDSTIVATAIPVIANDLSSATGYTWIGSAYLLANAVAGPIWASLSDIFGRKAIILSALATFFAASIGCAMADSMPLLIAMRALQGAAGSALILMPHVCVSDLFSLRQRSLFVGFMEAVWGLSGALGPILGGLFASLVSWRWCFWINLPICAVAFVLIAFTLDIKHEHTTLATGVKALDWSGIVAFLGFSCMLLLGLNFGGAVFPWDSSKVIALIVVGSIMIAVFVYNEARFARYPLVPMSLFRSKSNVASILVIILHGLVFISQEFYLPLFFQSVLGASPLRSGILLLPLLVTTALSGVITGLLIHRTGRYREIIWVGMIFLTLGSGLFILFDTHTSVAQAIGIQIIAGIGCGALFWPPFIALQSQVTPAEVAAATSTASFMRSVALSTSLVIGGTVFANAMDARSGSLRDAGLSAKMLEQLSGKNAAANVMLANTLNDPAQVQAVRQAFSGALKTMRIMYTVIAVVGFLAGLFVRQTHLSTDHTEHVTGIKDKRADQAVTSDVSETA